MLESTSTIHFWGVWGFVCFCVCFIFFFLGGGETGSFPFCLFFFWFWFDLVLAQYPGARPPPALTLVSAGLFLTLSSSLLSLSLNYCGLFLPFLKYTLRVASPSWLRGWARPCGGVGYISLEPAMPGPGQPRPLTEATPAGPPLASTWAPAPGT